ncbi:hypothetical protein HYE53_05550 [Aggregatibacter actinomycetemcomitans]|uniref:MarR family transcriptional regulator n=1 Tax=Aggregatibacter actinomycetemcomitans TaxID=714 RepID=UPI00197B1E47|nr:helix-turn-helix domain-containing protein [Aggregatibacter actinomycetemcomitans]MBN6070557.1 hypothetical protein [Aggregatibacter actinomycetemcomitans]
MTSYPKSKARSGKGAFIGILKNISNSRQFRHLSGNETKVFLHLYAEYNGSNNGNLTLPYNKASKELNLSRQLLSRTLKSLECKGWIVKSREGQRGREGQISLYAVTIEPVDEVLKNGVRVHDLPPTKTASHKWRDYSVT